MKLDLDVSGQTVVLCGTAVGVRRAVRRYSSAGATVRVLVDGDLPLVRDQAVGVRYTPQPAADDLAGWVSLLGQACLVVAVGPGAAANERLAGACGQLRILLAQEPAAERDGKVALVGGGPGSPRLLTVEACDILRDADVVFYDRLAPTDDLAALAPAAELINVGKQPYHHPVSQTEIERLMIDRALRGASVVRLKGGDPFVFGRGGEELIACARAGVPARVVPGISSAVSVPGAAGIPVTHRGVSRAFTVISGHDPLSSQQLESLAQLESTLVILMGMNNLNQIAAGLLRAGLAPDTPAAVVERGFSDRQRTTVATVATLADRVRAVGAGSPAVIVIGDVVSVAAEHAAPYGQLREEPEVAALLAALDPASPAGLGSP
ncbi:MAG TPA: uroporphyrinogen-III C-methyltransferase [Propionibacteriaceae bacterium]|nr:uroporphyrinogen-III C-methyltransferase [Propionibacteriaceae bacterium]